MEYTRIEIIFADEFWQLYFHRIGIPVTYFGLVSAGFMILRLPGNLFAYALIKLFRYRTLDSFQSLGLRAMVALAGLGFGWFSSRLDVFGGYAFLAVACGIFLILFLMASRRVVE
jgi:hypothetical protein